MSLIVTEDGDWISYLRADAQPVAVRVVFDGQSLLTIPTPTSAYYAMDGLDLSWRNAALPAISLTMLMNGGTVGPYTIRPASQRAFPFFTADFNLYVIVGGTTDIGTDADTGAVAFADLVTLADAARAAGADAVIAGTMPPGNVFSAGEETHRLTYNSLVLADSANDFDGTFDVSVAPLNDYTNTTYYADGLHWTALGAQIAGGIMQDAIVAALSAPPSALTATAIAASDRGGASPGPTTIVTSSVSPGADCALVLLVGGTVNSAGSATLFESTVTCSSSGSGPTWTRQAFGAGPSAGFNSSGAVFTAVIGGTDPGSFTTTIDFAGSLEAWNFGWTLYKVTGHNTSTPFTGAVGTRNQAADHSTVTATLTAAPTVDDITLALSSANVTGTGRGPGATFGTASGYWVTDVSSDGGKEVAWVAGQRTGVTSTSVVFSDTNFHLTGGGGFDSGQAAINIKALAPPPAPGPLTATLLHTGEMDWDDTAATGLTTPSITPGANCALVLLTGGAHSVGATALFDDASPNFLSIMSSSLVPVWTRQARGTVGTTFTESAAVFTTLIGSYDPGSFTVIVDFAGAATAGNLVWALYKVTGCDRGFPFAGAVATANQAGNGAVTPTLTATPVAGDITLALSVANVDSTGSTPGATFGSSFGTWTVNGVSNGTQKNAWVFGQRTGSTSTSVQFSDVNAHNANSYSSGQAAIILKEA